MSVSNIVSLVLNVGKGRGLHWYRTLDFSNPSSLWLIPSAPVFKKWFITGEPTSLSSLHQLSSGEPLLCAPLSSDYLPLTKLLFVFTGAVQCAESVHWPDPAAEKEVSSADNAGWKAGLFFFFFKCGTLQSTWQQCSSASRTHDPAYPTTPP